MTETTLDLRENLRDAMNDQALTANGGRTNASSLNKNVDFFFLAGASRGKDITPQFLAAYHEDWETALRILQWTRDVRGGAGERETFRTLFRALVTESAGGPAVRRLLGKVSELGRWDDLLVAFDTELERDALALIAEALVKDRNGLCAKWMPRKGEKANKIRRYLQLTPKSYRKLLVELSNTVEQKMCAKDWDAIEYGKLPSLASARYQKAFWRNDEDRYAAYVSALEKGEEKINAGAVYPYDIVKSLRFGNETVSNEQWKALPDYLDGSDESILPVVDVSGSMSCPVGGRRKSSVTCMDVAVSLGLYLSERNEGVFKDTFITFSGSPEMVTVKGTLKQRMEQMMRSGWAMNTNIQAVFETILAAAVKHKVPETGMPTMLLILSDMEFDHCVTVGRPQTDRYAWSRSTNESEVVTAMEMIEQKYAEAGYKVPQIVFWNLNGRAGNVPVEYNKAGAALVSGFSPALMTSLLGGEEMTPQAIMLKTVYKDRYAI